MIFLAKKIANISITILITLTIILLSVVTFNKSWLRLFETFTDFGSSISYYFCKILGIESDTVPTVTSYSGIFEWNGFLPDSSVKFKAYFSEFFSLFCSKENFGLWFDNLTDGLLVFLKIIVLGFPCFILVLILMQKLRSKRNTNYNKDTVPLRCFKWVLAKIFTPVIRFIRQFIDFLKDNDWIFIVWCITVGIMLNLGSIIVGFFAYYFYFAVSFDVVNLWVQLSKLIIDLQVTLKTVPLWLWLIIGYMVFDTLRHKRARQKLQRFEARNCGFISDLPIVSMTCGSMGKKKTTIITDMALSQAVMFRNKALELLQNNDMKFPYFSWISFEKDLRNCMEYGTVYNLATVKEWVQKKRERFEKNGCPELRLYGYDIDRYGLSYDDGLRIWYLFDVLSTYAQLYFIYVIECSLIVSNYSIREDNIFLDEGNFPIWISNFFPEQTAQEGNHAHILDFDILRLGKKVIENNPNNGSFEFGVVVISEVGKERGNNLELRDVKKTAEETNQKNDLFNSWLKMCRHSATVDNYPFIKVFTDEQRPESWGADARDLADIVNIAASSHQRIALPFYTIEEMLSEWIFNGFINLYYDFRFRRGDNTLSMYLLKSITAWVYKRNARLYNKFGFSISSIEKERGTMDGKIEKKKYYVMNKKIYSRRFSTDCFSDYFNDMAKKTKIGLNDYIEYATEKATADELKMQNSYFINALYKNAGSNP